MMKHLGKTLSLNEKKRLFFNALESAKKFVGNDELYFEEIWNFLDQAYDDEPNGMNGWEMCDFEKNWGRWLKEYQGVQL